jgi:Ca2+-binding RTX toxin-like protein
VLDGVAGDEYLVGGGGADDFLYHASTGVIAAGHDTIADFARGLDHIELDTALSAGAAAAALHIDISTADSLVTFDGSPDFLITVAGVHLDQSDFLFT